MDALFAAYAEALPRVRAWVDETFPRTRRRVRGRAPPRGQGQGARPAARPAARRLALAHGHLRDGPGLRAADPAPARRTRCPRRARYGELILDAIKAVMPSFVARVERPERGGEWVALPRAPPRRRPSAGPRASGSTARRGRRGRARRCGCCTSTATRTALLAALLFEAAARRRGRHAGGGRAGSARGARARCSADLVGERANRRHRPGRGFEALRYRFEIVSDYGAFRDLQRHRMLTVQWQALTPDLGAAVPEEVAAAGCGDAVRARARALARGVRAARRRAGLADAAPYALCLGYRIRYVLDLNAREAMHLIELRSGREGHPSYRAVAHEMHAQIADRHPAVAGGDDARRHERRAAPRAHPRRDAARTPRARRRTRADARRASRAAAAGSAQHARSHAAQPEPGASARRSAAALRRASAARGVGAVAGAR